MSSRTPWSVADYVADFSAFLAESPSSYHAAEAVAARLVAAGFERLDESAAWPGGDGARRCVVVRDGAVIAWRHGAGLPATAPARIVGTHTDSPGFKLKPGAGPAGEGWARAGVEVYGGPLLNSWLDRDLEFAGRLVTRDGASHLVRSGAIGRIPQLAIHLDRDANAGLTLERQRHTQPVFGVGEGELSELLAERAGLDPAAVVGADVLTVDGQGAARIGRDGELLAGPRLDNLVSVYAGLRALLAAGDGAGEIRLLAGFDHEELGSESRSGASGPLLADVLDRVWAGLGAGGEDRARALAASWCVSSDVGHAVHPNYPEKHDPVNRPRAGGGPILKLNANQRYATDAHGAALWARACAAAGVPSQDFVSNNDVPCGSTIGPLTATRLGIRTVDVGIPILSMHSARELAHVDDLSGLGRALLAFYAGA